MYKSILALLLLLTAAFPLKAGNTTDTAGDIADSLLTEKHITRLHISDPDRALQLLDVAEQRHIPGMDPFRIDLLRSMVYGSKSMYTLRERYIRRALENDSVRLVPQRKLRALTQLVVALEQQNRYEDGIRTANEALTLARQQQQSSAESELLSIIGRMYVGMHRPDEGISYMKQAITRLQQTENVRELAQISTIYGDLMATFIDQSRTQEAIETGLERAEIIRRMSLLPGPPPGYIDQQYGYLYSKMAFIYLLNRQPEKAEEAYRNYRATNYAKSAWGQGEGLPYLIDSGHYREAIDINRNLQERFRGQDTINYSYLIVLDRFARSYRGLQQHALSDAYQQRATVLTDSIYTREKESRAQELAVIFDTQEKEARIAQQSYQLNIHRTMAYSVSLILMLSLVFLLINCKNLRKIREKNRIIEEKNHIAMQRIDELLTQRKQLRQMWQEELKEEERKKEEEQQQKDLIQEKRKQGTPPKETIEPTPVQQQNRFLFQKMENSLLDGKAFLDPNYRRENLIELTHLNKNRLTEIIKECTGVTPNTYINHLRIEHAVHLMETHPHYSTEAIAADAGFNSKNTFYTVFREVFGISPSEYKKEKEQETDESPVHCPPPTVHLFSYSVHEAAPYINWIYFFHAWGFQPRFAAIAHIHDCDACHATWPASFPEEERAKAAEAMQLFKEANRMLNRLDESLTIRAVFRLCRANADGDNLLIEGITLPLLRQQTPNPDGSPHLCLSDFIRPLSSGIPDTVGLFATSVNEDAEKLYKDDPYKHLLVQTLNDRLAEAATEKMHEYVRKEAWGYAPDESLPIPDLLVEKYQGIRPAVGYPSLPDQSVNFLLDELLDMNQIGITLTENGAMHPHSSVCGMMLAHPASRYFAVGKIGEDQLEDYARRRGMPVKEMRKFLAANLPK